MVVKCVAPICTESAAIDFGPNCSPWYVENWVQKLYEKIHLATNMVAAFVETNVVTFMVPDSFVNWFVKAATY